MPESQALCASSSGFQYLAAFAPSSTFKNTSFHPDVSFNTSNMDIQDFQALSGSLMLTVENHLIEPVNNNAASIEGLELQYLSSYYSTPVYGPGSSNIITTRSGRVVEVAVADFFSFEMFLPHCRHREPNPNVRWSFGVALSDTSLTLQTLGLSRSPRDLTRD
jgi:hypothetical protein